jgi:hypothetical protein
MSKGWDGLKNHAKILQSGEYPAFFSKPQLVPPLAASLE